MLLSLVQLAAASWRVREGDPAASSTVVVLCPISFGLTEILYAVAPDGQLIMLGNEIDNGW